jgi:predicted transcriptional regulator
MSVIKFNLNNEIRRISVQKLPSFEEVSAILKRLYSKLSAEQSFVLQYKDSEGDVVTVSSNEELEEAFRNFSESNVARFVVIPSSNDEGKMCFFHFFNIP